MSDVALALVFNTHAFTLQIHTACFILYNRFAGESAIDAGGVSREWYQLVSEALFAPALGLFRYAQTDNMTYTINPTTARHFNTYETAVKTFGSLEVAYRFAGWFLGKAVLVRSKVSSLENHSHSICMQHKTLTCRTHACHHQQC
jgi:hypothetical protein